MPAAAPGPSSSSSPASPPAAGNTSASTASTAAAAAAATTTASATTAAHAGSAPAPAAAAAAAPRTGLLDLEKELSCSICADTLYQPLTLLDCLHTFCGSCLKEWFAWQLAQVDADPDADDARLRNPYTCPSCRAHVRGTRPDAKITTLLDMYLTANPGKGKSEEDRAEMRDKYAPGDDVVPRLRENLDEVKMVREAREMWHREQERARRGHAGYQRGTRHHHTQGARSDQGEEGGEEDSERARARAQQLGHQSSLRSLMSMDDIDSADMEEEIMRQIVEEGLLDGIDLSDLADGQIDELGERIAEAYRRRHGSRMMRQRQRSSSNVEDRRSSSPVQREDTTPRERGSSRRRDASRQRDSPRRRDASRQRDSSRRRDSPPIQNRRTSHQSTASATSATSAPRSPARSPVQTPPRSPGRSPGRAHASSDAHVPIQRDDLLQAYPIDPRRRRRSSESRRQTAPTASAASRSATDLVLRPESSARPRSSSRVASGSDTPLSHRHVLRESPLSRSPHASPVQSPPQTPASSVHPGGSSPRANSLSTASIAPSVTPFEHTTDQHPILASNAHYNTNAQVTAPAAHRRASSFSNSMPGVSRLQGFQEPVISCDRCKKPSIQYQLHHNCQTCRGGKFNICDRCYKAGKGCENWYGFGYNAWKRYQQKGAPSPQLPHVLLCVKYRRPIADELTEASTEDRLLAKDPPQKRRRTGAYCYICSGYAEDFFYKCDTCNDGEWGYCRNCVNQGRCCTHPLMPLAGVSSNRFKSSASDAARGVQAIFAPISNQNMVQPFPPSTTGSPRQYRPLSVSTSCDRCKCSISPTQTRFHCPECNDGFLEICAPCYSQLQDTGKIAPEDGISGWRRCPRGHRMIIMAFQDTDLGQCRVVLCDLVGGHFLKDDTGRVMSSGGNDGSNSGSGGNNIDRDSNNNNNNNSGPRHEERRYNWQDGDTGHSTTLSRPRMDAASVAGGANRFPPDGGVGKRCVARWSWIPEDGVANELLFPRGAEVTEVLDVNNEWCEGSYAGAKGVFPTSYVRMIEFVTM